MLTRTLLSVTPTLTRTILAAGVVLCACSSSDSSDSGGSGGSACSSIGYSKTAKIVNGDQCPISDSNDTSSVVKLEILSGGVSSGVCTGTAISSTAVLTAAHCFLGGSRSVDVVTTSGGSQQRIRSRSVSIHPGFTTQGGTLFVNDVAVVRTSRNLGVPITPLLLQRDTQPGEEAVVAGYGQTSAGSSLPDDVYAGYATVRTVTDDHVRIDFKANESHPCRGDSGGALLVQDGGLAIAGVVSQSDPSVSGDTICEVGDITLYTNIQKASVSSFVLSVAPDAAVR